MVQVKRKALDPADVAVGILRQRKKPISGKELIQLVYQEVFPEGAPNEVRAKAEIHTALSMDGRLTRVEKAWDLHRSNPARLKPVRFASRLKVGAKVRRRGPGGEDEDEDEDEVLEVDEVFEDEEADVGEAPEEESETEWD